MRIHLERFDVEGRGSQLRPSTTLRNRRLRVHGRVVFIVDTGAMRTVLMHDEGRRLHIPTTRLGTPDRNRGVGGDVEVFPLTDTSIYVKGSDREGNAGLLTTRMDLGLMDERTKGFFNLLGLDFFIQHSATLHIDFDRDEHYIEVPDRTGNC